MRDRKVMVNYAIGYRQESTITFTNHYCEGGCGSVVPRSVGTCPSCRLRTTVEVELGPQAIASVPEFIGWTAVA